MNCGGGLGVSFQKFIRSEVYLQFADAIYEQHFLEGSWIRILIPVIPIFPWTRARKAKA
jgi:hypothetical protein